MTCNTNNCQNLTKIQYQSPDINNINKINNNNKVSTNIDRDKTELAQSIEKYAKMMKEQKQMIMKLDKEKLADLVLKQNSMIAQQSNQMIDLVQLINDIDFNAAISEDKCKRSHYIYKEIEELNDSSINSISNSVKIQFILFILFIIVLIWLLFNFISFD